MCYDFTACCQPESNPRGGASPLRVNSNLTSRSCSGFHHVVWTVKREGLEHCYSDCRLCFSRRFLLCDVSALVPGLQWAGPRLRRGYRPRSRTRFCLRALKPQRWPPANAGFCVFCRKKTDRCTRYDTPRNDDEEETIKEVRGRAESGLLQIC